MKIFLPPTYLKAPSWLRLVRRGRSALLYGFLFSAFLGPERTRDLETERRCVDIELLGNKRPVNYGVWRLHNEKFSKCCNKSRCGSVPLAVCLAGAKVSAIAAIGRNMPH